MSVVIYEQPLLDMVSAKSDVNGSKKKVRFWRILINKKVKKNTKKIV